MQSKAAIRTPGSVGFCHRYYLLRLYWPQKIQRIRTGAAKLFRELMLTRTFALLIISGGAAWLRFYHLGDWSFWMDEALTVHDSLYIYNWLSVWGVIHGRPLNFWITGWVFSFLPVSEWSARLVPCITGVVTVPLVYYLSRGFLGSSAAMLSSIFLALSTWHIYWSQNARGYALLLLFSLISMGLFYTGVEKGNRLFLFGSLVAVGLAYLAHPVAILMVLSYCVYLALIALTGFKKPSGYRVNVLWSFVMPLIVAIIVAFPGLVELAGTVLNMNQPGNAFYVFASIGYYVQPAFLVLGMAGVGFLIFRGSRAGLFLGCLIVIPLVCLLTLSAIRGGSVLYVFHTLPVYYMAAAVILTEIMKNSVVSVKALRLAMVTALLALQVGALFEYFTHQYGDRPRWKEATQYVGSVASRTDLIASTAAPVVAYYLGGPLWNLRSPEKVLWVGRNNVEKIQSARNRTWLLLTNNSIKGDNVSHGVRAWLEIHCKIMRIFGAWTSLKNRSVLVYRCGL